MSGRLRDLIERRVPQYLAIYVGAGWGLIQFVSFLEERYSLSPLWTDLSLLVVALLIPSVILFTYNHGRPGRDRWTRAEKFGIPANAVLALVVLTSAFGGRDLGATTTSVTITDEAGNQIERRVARSTYRKRLAVFYLDGNPADTSVAWLRQGAAVALVADLSQDIFLDVRVPAHFREQLRDAGNADALNVPLKLKQKLASDLHLPYFIAGSVENGIEGYTVRVAVYETESLRRVRERVSTGSDIFAVIDDLSQQIREDLGLPQTRPEEVKDLPVAELLSNNVQAFRALVDGETAAYRDDWKAAETAFSRAAQLEPAFAIASYNLYLVRLLSGNAEGAIGALNAAMEHLYTLPERTQFSVKIDHYFMRQEMDKAFAVVEMMVELYPDDLQGHQGRAQLQEMRGDVGGAIASLRRVLELDPQQHEVRLKVGELQQILGAATEAVQTYQEYIRLFPQDLKAYTPLANVQSQLGDHAAARSTVERALVVDPTHIESKISLAMIDLDTGEFDASWKMLQETLAEARTAEDRARVWTGFQTYHSARGQFGLAIDANAKRTAATAEHAPPFIALTAQMSALDLYARAGRVNDAQQVLTRVRTGLTAPLDEFWRIGQLRLASELRDTAQIVQAVAGVEAIIRSFNFQHLRPIVVRGQAMLHESRGDWNGALRLYEQQLELDPRSLSVRRDFSRMYRSLGRYDDAHRAITEHLRVSPASAESNIEAARVMLARGDTAGAGPFLQQAARTLAQADAGSAIARELRSLSATAN